MATVAKSLRTSAPIPQERAQEERWQSAKRKGYRREAKSEGSVDKGANRWTKTGYQALHLHQVGQKTLTSKLLSMPSTQRSRWRGGRYACEKGAPLRRN
jgi:hypothetical protein